MENFNRDFIGGVVIDSTFNTSHTYEVCSTPFYLTEGLVRVKVESGDWYEVVGGKPTVDFNSFEKYYTYVIRPPNIVTVKPEINMVADKYQDKEKFISIQGTLIDIEESHWIINASYILISDPLDPPITFLKRCSDIIFFQVVERVVMNPIEIV